MASLNITDISTAFSAYNLARKLNRNRDGGIYLWTLPISRVFYAFNPYTIKLENWKYYIAGDYEPTIVLSKLTIEDNKIKSAIAPTSAIYVTAYVQTTIGDVITYGYLTYRLPAGQTEITPSASDTLINLVGLGQYNIYSDSGGCYDDSDEFFYIANKDYEDDRLIYRGGHLIYKDLQERVSNAIEIVNIDSSESVILESYFASGESFFDLSAICKSFFARDLADFQTITDIETSATAEIAYDRKLFQRFNVLFGANITNVGEEIEVMAINGCTQIGSNSLLFNSQVLTKLDVTKKYSGYPLEQTTLVSNVKYPLPLNPSGNIDINPNCVVRERIDWRVNDVVCTPKNPFYVRFINRFGGVEQYMFSRRQKWQESVKSVQLAETFIVDVEPSRTNEVAYDIETENTIVVGAEGVEDSVYEVIRWIPFSPCVEWYDESRSKWIRLTTAKYDGERMSDSNLHKIEIEFKLPKMYVQF